MAVVTITATVSMIRVSVRLGTVEKHAGKMSRNCQSATENEAYV